MDDLASNQSAINESAINETKMDDAAERQGQLDLLAEIRAQDPSSGAGPIGRARGAAMDDGAVLKVRHDMIAPARGNRPSGMDAEALAGLAASIHEWGLLQPLVVAPPDGSDRPYRIVAGERRWRAIGLLIAAGSWPEGRPLRCVAAPPCDDAHLALARLTENIQREDLNPLDECELIAAAVAAHDAIAPGRGTAVVATALGKKLRWVQIRRRVGDHLGPIDKARLRAGDIGIAEARALVAEPKPGDGAGQDNGSTDSGAAGDAGRADATASACADGGAESAAPVPPQAAEVGYAGVRRTPTAGGADESAADERDASSANAPEKSAAARRADHMATLAPVTETRLVRAIALDVVATAAVLTPGDPFPARLVMADPRTGVCVDYVRAPAGEDGAGEAATAEPPFVKATATGAAAEPHLLDARAERATGAAAPSSAVVPSRDGVPGTTGDAHLDLRGLVGRNFGAVVAGMLEIPRFLRRNEDGSRAFPDAKPEDGR